MSFSLKNCKNCPALEAMLPDPTLSLSRYKILAARFTIAAAFKWHKQKDDNTIKLISNSAAAVVTDINKLQIMTLFIKYDILKPCML